MSHGHHRQAHEVSDPLSEILVTFVDGPCKGNQYVIAKDTPMRQVLKSGLDENGVSVYFQCIYVPGPDPTKWHMKSCDIVPADFKHTLSRRYDK